MGRLLSKLSEEFVKKVLTIWIYVILYNCNKDKGSN